MKLCLLAAALFVSVFAIAQSPVRWTFGAKKISDQTYELRMSANVQEPWHIYSQTTPEGGPLPTKVSFTKNPLVTLDGNVVEKGKVVKKYEDVFELDVAYFDGNAEFTQLVKVKGKAKTRVSGVLEFMVCNDTQCLPPAKVPFTIDLN